METMIQRCRNNLCLVASFGDSSDLLTNPVPPTTRGNGNGNPATMATNYPRVRNTKRKMSQVEQQVVGRQYCSQSSNNDTIQINHEHTEETRRGDIGPMPKRKMSKTCGLCRQQGHKVTKCCALEEYTGTLLPFRRACSKEIRDQLAVDLSIPHRLTRTWNPQLRLHVYGKYQGARDAHVPGG